MEVAKSLPVYGCRGLHFLVIYVSLGSNWACSDHLLFQTNSRQSNKDVQYSRQTRIIVPFLTFQVSIDLRSLVDNVFDCHIHVYGVD